MCEEACSISLRPVDVLVLDAGIPNPVKFLYQVVSSKILLDSILISEIGEIGVKTLERELKSCLTGSTSHAFMCRLTDMFKFYLNQL